MLPERKWANLRKIYLLGIIVTAFASNLFIGKVADYSNKELTGFLTIAMLMVFFFIFLLETLRLENGYRIEKYYNYRRIMLYFIGWSLFEIILYIIPDFSRPVMLIAITATFILNTTVGFLLNSYFATMLILADHGSVELYLLYTLTGIIGCLLTGYLKENKSFIWASISLIASNMCLTILFEYLANEEFKSLIMVQSLFAGLFTVVVIQIMLPYIIHFVDNGLYRRLWNICNSKNILLKQLHEHSAVDYQHTVAVAQLSGEAAELIGADSLLAKVGGLYHRIGLVQGKDYIDETIKIAVEYDFPMELIQLLYEYSGRYRLPASKESAIVMIVNSVLINFSKLRNDITTGKTNKDIVVQQTFNELLAKGLLDDSGITFKMYMDLKALLGKR